VLDGVPLIAIGYKYNKKRVLHFVMSENAGDTTLGEPYQMKFPDQFGNIHIREVSRPDVISRYFQDSNCVDVHNQLRQYALRLEKKWVTTNPYFRLHTTLTGINVVDTFQLASFHGIIGRDQSLTTDYDDDEEEKNVTAIQRFGGILAKQLVMKAQGLNERRKELFRVRMNCLGTGMGDFASSQESNEINEEDDEVGISAALDEDVSTISGIGGGDGNGNSDDDDEDSIIKGGKSVESGSINNKNRNKQTVLLHSMVDRMGSTHQAVKNQWKVQKNGDRAGKGYTPAYVCSMDGCKKKSRVHCYQCNKVFCFSLVDDKESSMGGSTGMVTGDTDSCFVKHVHQVKRKSRRY
jgi:hypothetical protein